MALAKVRTSVAEAMEFAQQWLSKPGSRGRGIRFEGLVFAGVLLIVVPWDFLQLFCVSFGAFCLWLTQRTNDETTLPAKRGKAVDHRFPAPAEEAVAENDGKTVKSRGDREMRKSRLPRPLEESERKMPEKAPVVAMNFQTMGWNAGVDAFLTYIKPSAENMAIVEQVGFLVKQAILNVFPDATVVGYTSNRFGKGHRVRVDVPDVDIVVNVSEDDLVTRLQAQSTKANKALLSQMRDEGKLDPAKLHKSAIRIVTERLTTKGFKFARSAFRGFDPKVTMFAPAAIIPAGDPELPFDLSINGVIPSYMALLTAECARLEPRAQGLLLLVRHWAKNRSICFAPKGFLPPYLWTLMTIYFLQVRDKGEGPLLPPLKVSLRPAGIFVIAPSDWAPQQTQLQVSVGSLMKEFAHFYSKQFDYPTEIVSIRSGKRFAPPQRGFRKQPAHVITNGDGQHEVAPTIEDPTDPTRTLRTPMTWTSLSRIRAELARADSVCSRPDGSLDELVQPWVAPDWNAAQHGQASGAYASVPEKDGDDHEFELEQS